MKHKMREVWNRGRRSLASRVILGAALLAGGVCGCANRPTLDGLGRGVAAPDLSLYVALNGNDANDGSVKSPFATLARARDAVRALKAQGGLPDGGITVWLRGGVYRVKGTFVLGKEDSGTVGAPVVYAAMPGETVRLSGGTPLEKSWFEPLADKAILARIVDERARDKIVCVDLKAHGITNYGALTRSATFPPGPGPAELYVGGRRMHLARWPNPEEDTTRYLDNFNKDRRGEVSRGRVIAPGPDRTSPDFDKHGGTFAYEFDRPAHWAAADDIWLYGILSWSWEWTYNQVASIDHANRRMTMRYGEQSSITNVYSGTHFYFDNLIEEIDQPEEYVLDRKTGWLYLYPPAAWEKVQDVELTTFSERMISAGNASWVTFRDLILETTRSWILIEISDGERMLIDSCELRNFYGYGAIISGRNNGIARCHIHHGGHTAVWVRGGKFETLEPGGSFVEDCEIHDSVFLCTTVMLGCIPNSSVGLRASHNLIYNCPGTAIGVGGNDHLIEYNELHHVAQIACDSGATYSMNQYEPFLRGNVYRRNYIHHIGINKTHQNGIYLDFGIQGDTVEENVFYRIGGADPTLQCAAFTGFGNDVTIRRNLFIDCSLPINLVTANSYIADAEKPFRTCFEKNAALLPFFGKKYPQLLTFFEDLPRWGAGNVVDGNVVLNGEVPRLETYFNLFPIVDGIKCKLKADDPEFRGKLMKHYAGATPAGVVTNGEIKLTDAVFKLTPGFPKLSLAEVGPRCKVGPHAGRASAPAR